eukprot:TRINITY_DN4710_c0_g1_i1.p1 TRINITY_DN4710_c0_g1~~TRINITY_DN4710_c0_g1_i1.p1  ORF type:complete len:349 (+),score=25.80 TRINITY_DN4710_c0_g1_i1:42-1049(+)
MESNRPGEGTHTLTQIPLFEEIRGSEGVLISGCGGGYDIYSGIPLYFALSKMGFRVYLSNLTFAYFEGVDRNTAKEINKDCLEITASSQMSGTSALNDYFPEKYLSMWFKDECKKEVPVYMFSRTATIPLKAAYEALVKYLNVDTVLLVDGGTDSLMRGNEHRLGSPHEDVASIAAVDDLQVKKKLLACIGFGIDHFHGVSHTLFLENVADIIKKGGFLGTFSVIKEMEEARMYQAACDYAFKRMEISIVSGSILAAIEGKYGDVKLTPRTGGSKLWINPLMSMYWCFRLRSVAANLLCLEEVKKTKNSQQLHNAIFGGNHRVKDKLRNHEPVPL